MNADGRPGPVAGLLWSALRRNRPSVPLGAGAGDDVRLADSPPLAHLARAIEGGDALRARDLFGPGLELVAAPDPTPWLKATCAGNPAPAADAVPLRVLCWNIALLDVWILGRLYRQSPFVDERREPVFRALLDSDADIVLVQELWHARDQQRLAELAPSHGYLLACPPRPHVDGLAILVKQQLAVGPLEVTWGAFEHQDRLEALVLPGKEQFLRSWLCARFDHPALGRLAVFDSHMAPYPPGWMPRLVQSRSLGLRVAREPDDSLVLVGGDFNAGPFYGRQTWLVPGGGITHGWWHNAMSLPLLQHHGGLTDLAVRGRPAADADLEVRLSRALPNIPEQVDPPPFACTEQHRRAFTATDCNRLYRMQYAGTEQPARLDHLLARDPDGRVHVAAARHRFVEPVLELGGAPAELSDHYGVEVELRVAPR